MKTLHLLRHAKSSWSDLALSDIERPLNERGRYASSFMGEYMKMQSDLPDLVISSPAVRAKDTAERFSKAGGISDSIVFDPRIYEANTTTLFEIVSGIDDEFKTAMIVGHNPGIESIAEMLTGVVVQMPTAALAVIDLDADHWREIRVGCNKLRAVYLPKELMSKSRSRN